MAGEERTEQATPKKRQDAREKGQVAKSMEINAALSLLAGVMALRWFGGNIVTQWNRFATEHLVATANFQMTTDSLQHEFLTASTGFMKLIFPIVITLMVVGLAANLLQTGFAFSTNTLKPDFGRLNPLQGFARMFSMRSSMDLVKSSAKAAIVGYMIYAFFRDRGVEIVRLIICDYHNLGSHIADLAYGLLMKCIITLCIIAGLDYLFQRWQFEKTLRMTKQEIKEEYKRSEGDPLIKSRIRQRQREFSQRRMMSDVKRATVIITNPTHYAVALRYEPGEMLAPQVIAKGQNLVAQKIKEIARDHRIPVVEDKPLARSLFAACNIGDTIPIDLFQAVAEIIAFVFKQSGRVQGSTVQANNHSHR